MKGFKRILALVLCLTMLVGMCPVVAAEPEEDSLIYLHGAELSNTEEPNSGSGEQEQTDTQEYIFVYSAEEF